jgi:hypothetical protein
MAISYNKTCCQSMRSSFLRTDFLHGITILRTDFSHGITNFTQVKCSKQSGTLSLFAALTMQVDGWRVLERHSTDLDTVLGTMECLLSFEAWLDQLTFWGVNNTTGEVGKAEAAITSLMHLIVQYFP